MIYIGNKELKDCRVGNIAVNSIYAGSKLVWSRQTPVIANDKFFVKHAETQGEWTWLNSQGAGEGNKPCNFTHTTDSTCNYVQVSHLEGDVEKIYYTYTNDQAESKGYDRWIPEVSNIKYMNLLTATDWEPDYYAEDLVWGSSGGTETSQSHYAYLEWGGSIMEIQSENEGTWSKTGVIQPAVVYKTVKVSGDPGNWYSYFAFHTENKYVCIWYTENNEDYVVFRPLWEGAPPA